MNILLVNFFAYLLWDIYTICKEKKLSLYSYILTFFTVIAFLGYFIVETGIYAEQYDHFNFNKVSYEPYILCFITYVILFYPLKGLKVELSDNSFLFSKDMKFFVRIWKIFFIIYLLFKIYEFIMTISYGFANAYDTRHNLGESLFTYDNIIAQKINGWGPFLLNATAPIIMCYAFLGLYYHKIKGSETSFLIFLAIVPSILSSMAAGSRGALFMAFFTFAFYILLFWDYIPKRYRNIAFKYGVIFLTVILLFSFIITGDRNDNTSTGSITNILRYFGEAFPNLGNLFYGQVSFHPMGARFFDNILFKNYGGYYTSVDESYQFWTMMTGVHVEVFKTYFGDMYIEFGRNLGMLITLLTTILMKLILRMKKLGICLLPIIYFYFQLCTYAFAGMTKTNESCTFQLTVIVVVTVALYFYKEQSKRSNKNFIPNINK